MQPVQQLFVAHLQVAAGLAERRTAEMRDEHSRHRDVAPAEMPRAQAEVVLLAVALGEDLGAEWADGVDAVAPQIQAEADADRDIDHAPLVGAAGDGVQPDGRGAIRHRIAARGPG